MKYIVDLYKNGKMFLSGKVFNLMDNQTIEDTVRKVYGVTTTFIIKSEQHVNKDKKSNPGISPA